MGKLADQIKTDCCGSLLNDKAQLVRDVAALELESQLLKTEVITANAERAIYQCVIKDARSTCRTVFDTMYTAAPKYKEQVWANLCLTLGIEA
jgi:hypothetical protein